MNTAELRSKLQKAAQDCSSDADIRAALMAATAGPDSRRRRGHVALTAVAAAVIVIAGSVATVATHMDGAPAAPVGSYSPPSHSSSPSMTTPTPTGAAARNHQTAPAAPSNPPATTAQTDPPAPSSTKRTTVAAGPPAAAVKMSNLAFPVDLSRLGSSWSVLARWESPELFAVDFAGAGSNAGLQGEVQYAADPAVIAVAANATTITVDGHRAKMWNRSKTYGQIKASSDPADGYQVFAAWAWPGGGTVKVAADNLNHLALVAKLVSDRLHPAAPLLTTAVTAPGYPELTVIATGLPDGGRPVGQLCNKRTPFQDDPDQCITVDPGQKGTTLAQRVAGPPDGPTADPDRLKTYRTMRVGGHVFFVAPDGQSVLTLGAAGTPLLVTAPSNKSAVSTSELIAIAVGVDA